MTAIRTWYRRWSRTRNRRCGVTGVGAVLVIAATATLGGTMVEATPTRAVVHGEGEDPGLRAARAFLATLATDDLDRVSAPINAADRVRWSYLPGKRLGIRLDELDGRQRSAWRSFLATRLSEAGLARIDRIRNTEPVHERGGGVVTGPEIFAIRFHGLDGDPGSTPRAWAWRLEGHHLHVGETIVDGRVVSATPFMLGSVRRQDESGEVFAFEDAAAARILAGVPGHERATASPEGRVPGDMLTAMRPSREWRLDGGLPLHRAGEGARAIADGIVDGLLGLRREEVVAELRERWQETADPEIRFVWVGDVDRGRTHQWRLVSPVLVVEFSHSGGDVEHAHLALRTVDGELPGGSAWADAPIGE